MCDQLTTDVRRLLTMCNYYHEITKDDKDFLALLAGRLERYDGELDHALKLAEDNGKLAHQTACELAEMTEQRDTLAAEMRRYLPVLTQLGIATT